MSTEETEELGAVLEIIIKDKDGRVVETRRYRTHSFTQNFVNIITAMLQGAWSTSVVNTGGSSATFHICADSNVCTNCWPLTYGMPLANPQNVYLGLVVGSGTASPSYTDYNLETPIQPGSSSNQLLYGGTSVYLGSPQGGMIPIIISATFTNSSGSSILINEIGLITYDLCGNQALIAHDLLGPSTTVTGYVPLQSIMNQPINLANGASVTIVYYIWFPVP